MENRVSGTESSVAPVESQEITQPDLLANPPDKKLRQRLIVGFFLSASSLGVICLLVLRSSRLDFGIKSTPIPEKQMIIKDKPGEKLLIPSLAEPLILKSRERTTRIIKPKIALGVLGEVIPTPEIGIYRVNSFIPSLAQAKTLAQKFGFSGEVEQPDEYGRPLVFRWSNPTSSLMINQRQYEYNSAPAQGSLPTSEEAILAATDFLKTRSLYSSDIVASVAQKQKVDLFVDLYDKDHPYYKTKTEAILVEFLKQQNGLPIVFGDIGDEQFSSLKVYVGPNSEIVRARDLAYGFLINQESPGRALLKELSNAASEFEETGGAVRWVSPIPGKSWSTSGKYEIQNSLITKVYQAYYFDDSLGVQYPQDLSLRNTGYLLPVWVFVGSGDLYGGDYSGEKVNFVSTLYAFKELEGEDGLFKVQSLDVDKEVVAPEATASAYFNFTYDSLLPPQYREYRPRQGLKFKFEVTYPDGKNSEAVDLIRDPNYGELVWIYSGSQKGELRVKTSLVDFPSVCLEKTIKVSTEVAEVANEVLVGGVYEAVSGTPIPKTKVILKNKATGEEFSTIGNDKGEFRIEGLSTGIYTVTVTSTDRNLLKTETVEILSREQNLRKFNRSENYLNFGIE